MDKQVCVPCPFARSTEAHAHGAPCPHTQACSACNRGRRTTGTGSASILGLLVNTGKGRECVRRLMRCVFHRMYFCRRHLFLLFLGHVCSVRPEAPRMVLLTAVPLLPDSGPGMTAVLCGLKPGADLGLGVRNRLAPPLPSLFTVARLCQSSLRPPPPFRSFHHLHCGPQPWLAHLE